mmetsp:Transcript_52093/g.150136  ORF Transcript_52093/g.150136 Transcript_52093/m.150136 type:complete len:277 (-) Transcript_52093:505-1335(-)
MEAFAFVCCSKRRRARSFLTPAFFSAAPRSSSDTCCSSSSPSSLMMATCTAPFVSGGGATTGGVAGFAGIGAPLPDEPTLPDDGAPLAAAEAPAARRPLLCRGINGAGALLPATTGACPEAEAAPPVEPTAQAAPAMSPALASLVDAWLPTGPVDPMVAAPLAAALLAPALLPAVDITTPGNAPAGSDPRGVGGAAAAAAPAGDDAPAAAAAVGATRGGDGATGLAVSGRGGANSVGEGTTAGAKLTTRFWLAALGRGGRSRGIRDACLFPASPSS